MGGRELFFFDLSFIIKEAILHSKKMYLKSLSERSDLNKLLSFLDIQMTCTECYFLFFTSSMKRDLFFRQLFFSNNSSIPLKKIRVFVCSLRGLQLSGLMSIKS